jgi:predicted nucleic acid-binding protein
MRAFVDTNVWVYAVDDAEPHKQALARAAVAPSQGTEVIVSAQVLGEFYVTVRRRFETTIPVDDAVALVDRLRQLTVVPIDGALAASAIASSEQWQVSYWDALILEAAAAADCDVLLSEDLAEGRRYGSVRVQNPFAPAAAVE